MTTYMMDPAEAICVCNHWTDEHDAETGWCYGCDAGGDNAALHAFQLDVENSSPENIASRGGDPDKWPQWVKDYFGPDKMREWTA